jgi:hypothetical protein
MPCLWLCQRDRGLHKFELSFVDVVEWIWSHEQEKIDAEDV